MHVGVPGEYILQYPGNPVSVLIPNVEIRTERLQHGIAKNRWEEVDLHRLRGLHALEDVLTEKLLPEHRRGGPGKGLAGCLLLAVLSAVCG